MRLRSKSLERALWARLKPHDTRSFWDKVAHYLNAGIDLSLLPGWPFRATATLAWTIVAFYNRESVSQHSEVWLAGMGLWAIFQMLSWCELFWTDSLKSPSLRVVSLLPLPFDPSFQRVFRRMQSGACFLATEFLLLYGLLASQSGQLWPVWLIAIGCALLQGGLAVCLASLIIRFRLNSGIFPFFSLLPAAPLAIIGTSHEVAAATAHLLINPLGWVSVGFLQGCLRANGAAWWALAPVLFGLLIGPPTLPALRRLYCEKPDPKIFRTRPFSIFLPLGDDGFNAAEGVEPVKEIRSRDFVHPVVWAPLGFVERLIGHLLNARERLVAETVSAHLARLSRNYWGLMIFLALFLGANLLIDQTRTSNLDDLLLGVLSPNKDSGLTLIAIISSFILVTVMIQKVVGFLLWPRSIPIPLLPVSAWEVAKVNVKISTLQIILLFPPAALVSLTPLWQLVLQGTNLSTLLLKILIVLWCGSVLLPSFILTSKLSARTLREEWFMRVKFIFLTVSFYPLAACYLFGPHSWLQHGSGAVLIIGSFAWFVHYGKCYRKGHLP